jgi:hypothetical protein
MSTFAHQHDSELNCPACYYGELPQFSPAAPDFTGNPGVTCSNDGCQMHPGCARHGECRAARDQELLRLWQNKDGTFSQDHASASMVAWEAARHARDCGCWRHAVLRAIGWPTVTSLPGSPHVIFEDDSLPHQIRLSFSGHRIDVSCTCLQRPGGNGRGRLQIEARSPFPAREAMAAYRSWHADHGELVQS